MAQTTGYCHPVLRLKRVWAASRAGGKQQERSFPHLSCPLQGTVLGLQESYL